MPAAPASTDPFSIFRTCLPVRRPPLSDRSGGKKQYLNWLQTELCQAQKGKESTGRRPAWPAGLPGVHYFAQSATLVQPPPNLLCRLSAWALPPPLIAPHSFGASPLSSATIPTSFP